MTAADQWRDQLAEWSIPQPILDAAPESPWGFDTDLFTRRAEAATRQLTPSNERALEALQDLGTVLDVGCGGGAASLPLAAKASRLVGVDSSPDMLAAFRERGRSLAKNVTTVTGRWPDIAGQTPIADIAVCHHVAYNVPDLAEFALRLSDHAQRRVVMELTAVHPMTRLSKFWLHFHGLRRPTGPTADDAVAVLQELGIAPERFNWEESRLARMMSFSSRENLVRWIRRRLCLPAERDTEIWKVASPDLVEERGEWTFPSLGLVTLWWPDSAS